MFKELFTAAAVAIAPVFASAAQAEHSVLVKIIRLLPPYKQAKCEGLQPIEVDPREPTPAPPLAETAPPVSTGERSVLVSNTKSQNAPIGEEGLQPIVIDQREPTLAVAPTFAR